MICREAAHALSVRSRKKAGQVRSEVLLEQRPASLTVMPGLWELPMLRKLSFPRRICV